MGYGEGPYGAGGYGTGVTEEETTGGAGYGAGPYGAGPYGSGAFTEEPPPVEEPTEAPPLVPGRFATPPGPRRLAIPFTITRGRLAALAQDSPAEISQSVGLLLATPPGDRRSVPGYGLPDPVFGGINPDTIIAVAAEWEDRADPVDVIQVATGVTEHANVYPTERQTT